MENGFVRVLFPSPTGYPAALDSTLRRPLVPAILRNDQTQVDDTAVRELLRLLRQEDQLRDFLAPPTFRQVLSSILSSILLSSQSVHYMTGGPPYAS
jgi:hypothetical protein